MKKPAKTMKKDDNDTMDRPRKPEAKKAKTKNNVAGLAKMGSKKKG